MCAAQSQHTMNKGTDRRCEGRKKNAEQKKRYSILFCLLSVSFCSLARAASVENLLVKLSGKFVLCASRGIHCAIKEKAISDGFGDTYAHCAPTEIRAKRSGGRHSQWKTKTDADAKAERELPEQEREGVKSIELIAT